MKKNNCKIVTTTNNICEGFFGDCDYREKYSYGGGCKFYRSINCTCTNPEAIKECEAQK